LAAALISHSPQYSPKDDIRQVCLQQ